MRERLAHQLVAERERRRVVERLQQPGVVAGIHQHQHAAEILGRSPHQRRAADVDLLDQRIERRLRIGRRFHERIEVDDDDIDQAEAVALERRQIVRAIAPRQDASVQRRMERLDPPVHHLGKTGQRGHAGDGESRLRQRPRGAAGRDQFETARREAARHIDDAGLVRNA